MKRLIFFAGALGVMWAAPAYSKGDSSDPRADHKAAHADQKDNKDNKDKRPSRTDKRTVDAANDSAARRDVSKHAGDASQHAAERAHDRAMAHAASDANASHVDAANRAAMHWANGSRGEATSEAHDAAGQMRTRLEHGDARGMDGHGEGGGEGEGGRGEGRGGMSGSSTTRTGR